MAMMLLLKLADTCAGPRPHQACPLREMEAQAAALNDTFVVDVTDVVALLPKESGVPETAILPAKRPAAFRVVSEPDQRRGA